MTMRSNVRIETVSATVKLPNGREVALVEQLSEPARVLGITAEHQVLDLTHGRVRVMDSPWSSLDAARASALATLCHDDPSVPGSRAHDDALVARNRAKAAAERRAEVRGMRRQGESDYE